MRLRIHKYCYQFVWMKTTWVGTTLKWIAPGSTCCWQAYSTLQDFGKFAEGGTPSLGPGGKG
jgi:hypothetical protein